MPEMLACLTNASLGGKTRFSWSTDTIVFVAMHSSAQVCRIVVGIEPGGQAVASRRVPGLLLRSKWKH
jgi:hypothetical protein